MNEFEFCGDVQQAILLPPTGAAKSGFRVVAIDIYEDGIGLRWAAPAPPQPSRDDLDSDSHHAALPDIRLADDVGTKYFHDESGAGWNDDVMRGETIFGPPLSPNARHLTVYADGREFELDLSQALRRG